MFCTIDTFSVQETLEEKKQKKCVHEYNEHRYSEFTAIKNS